MVLNELATLLPSISHRWEKILQERFLVQTPL